MTNPNRLYEYIDRHQQLLDPPTGNVILSSHVNGLHTGYIEGTIQTLTDTHIGTGAHAIVDKQLVLGNIVNPQGYPIIPASSIKGYLRNMVATIAGDSIKTRNPTFSDYIFGMMSNRSKVSVGEALNTHSKSSVVTTVPRRFPPHDNNQDSRRFYPHRDRILNDNSGAVPIAVIPPRTEFSWRMSYQNLNDLQLGSLLIALGYNRADFAFKLGGAKAFGCGSVQVVNLKVHDRTNSFSYAELDGLTLGQMQNAVVISCATVLNDIYRIHHWLK